MGGPKLTAIEERQLRLNKSMPIIMVSLTYIVQVHILLNRNIERRSDLRA